MRPANPGAAVPCPYEGPPSTSRAARRADDVTVGLEIAHAGDTLDVAAGALLGRVNGIAADRLTVAVTDPSLGARVGLSDLVGIPMENDTLIGVVERATTVPGSAGHSGTIELRIMPVGTLRADSKRTGRRFVRATRAYPHLAAPCHLIEGDQLSAFAAIVGESVRPGERLILGRYAAERGAVAVADGNRLFQRHLAVVGATGTGKSWAVSLMLERASRLRHANMVVFDLHGEYGPLTESSNGAQPLARKLRIAGPGDLEQDSPDLLYLPYWLLERDELLALALNPDDPHASDQQLCLTERVQALKRATLYETGHEDVASTFTVDSPIPFKLGQLIDWLKRDDTEKLVRQPSGHIEPGPYMGQLGGLIARLEARAANPRYGFIFDPPAQTLIPGWLEDTVHKLLDARPGESGLKVIDLSEVPSSILPMVAGVIARLIYEVQFWMDPQRRSPVCLVCDEAHLYMPVRQEAGLVHHAALEAFESIAKEGRKYGVGLLVVSQRPSDVSRTILSQCNNFVVMRLTNDHDRALVERLLPEALLSVAGGLPALDVGEAMIIGDAVQLPVPVRFDAPTMRPASATQAYWSLWAEQASSTQAISDGVEAMRTKVRGGISQRSSARRTAAASP